MKDPKAYKLAIQILDDPCAEAKELRAAGMVLMNELLFSIKDCNKALEREKETLLILNKALKKIEQMEGERK